MTTHTRTPRQQHIHKSMETQNTLLHTAKHNITGPFPKKAGKWLWAFLLPFSREGMIWQSIACGTPTSRCLRKLDAASEHAALTAYMTGHHLLIHSRKRYLITPRDENTQYIMARGKVTCNIGWLVVQRVIKRYDTAGSNTRAMNSTYGNIIPDPQTHAWERKIHYKIRQSTTRSKPYL
jgi:hypothetical protein